jgi:hypothetical protein
VITALRAAQQIADLLRLQREHGGALPSQDVDEFLAAFPPDPSPWIPVTKRIPPPRQDFIALNRDGRIFRSRMCYGMHEPWFTYPQGDKNASDTMPDWIDVTHWMELKGV